MAARKPIWKYLLRLLQILHPGRFEQSLRSSYARLRVISYFRPLMSSIGQDNPAYHLGSHNVTAAEAIPYLDAILFRCAYILCSDHTYKLLTRWQGNVINHSDR